MENLRVIATNGHRMQLDLEVGAAAICGTLSNFIQDDLILCPFRQRQSQKTVPSITAKNLHRISHFQHLVATSSVLGWQHDGLCEGIWIGQPRGATSTA